MSHCALIPMKRCHFKICAALRVYEINDFESALGGSRINLPALNKNRNFRKSRIAWAVLLDVFIVIQCVLASVAET